MSAAESAVENDLALYQTFNGLWGFLSPIPKNYRLFQNFNTYIDSKVRETQKIPAAGQKFP